MLFAWLAGLNRGFLRTVNCFYALLICLGTPIFVATFAQCKDSSGQDSTLIQPCSANRLIVNVFYSRRVGSRAFYNERWPTRGYYDCSKLCLSFYLDGNIAVNPTICLGLTL